MIENIDFKKYDNIIRNLERDIIILKNDNKNYQQEIDELTSDNERRSEDLKYAIEAIDFIEKAANHERNLVKDKVEGVISDALKEIYGDEYSIKFDYTMKRNKTSVDIYLVKHTKIGDIIRKQDGFGGGVSDIISLPLKLLVLMALQKNDKILIADEPGKHMDDRVDKFGFFLKNVSEKLGIQIIILTHFQSMTEFADSVYEVSMIDKVTSLVERVK